MEMPFILFKHFSILFFVYCCLAPPADLWESFTTNDIFFFSRSSCGKQNSYELSWWKAQGFNIDGLNAEYMTRPNNMLSTSLHHCEWKRKKTSEIVFDSIVLLWFGDFIWFCPRNKHANYTLLNNKFTETPSESIGVEMCWCGVSVLMLLTRICYNSSKLNWRAIITICFFFFSRFEESTIRN